MDKSKPFYFERQPSGDIAPQPESGNLLNDSSQISINASQTSSNGGLNKTYFKLAKTMQLFSQDSP